MSQIDAKSNSQRLFLCQPSEDICSGPKIMSESFEICHLFGPPKFIYKSLRGQKAN